MDPSADDIRLIHTFGLSADVMEREAALLTDLTEAEVAEVLPKLKEMARFEGMAVRTAQDASAAAVSLGIGQTSFYRLMAAARTMGPVSSLLKADRRRFKPSMRRDGLPPALEAVLCSLLEENPQIRWRDAIPQVRKRATDEGLTPPSEGTVRLRIAELRRGPPPRHLRAGRSLSLIRTTYQMPQGEHWVTALLDDDTDLVLGIGQSTNYDDALAFFLADARGRIRKLANSQGVPFANRIERISLDAPELPNWSKRWLGTMKVSLPEADALLTTGLASRLTKVFASALRELAKDVVVENAVSFLFVARAASQWNEVMLSNRRPRSKRDVDQGEALLAALDRLMAVPAEVRSGPRIHGDG